MCDSNLHHHHLLSESDFAFVTISGGPDDGRLVQVAYGRMAMAFRHFVDDEPDWVPCYHVVEIRLPTPARATLRWQPVFDAVELDMLGCDGSGGRDTASFAALMVSYRMGAR